VRAPRLASSARASPPPRPHCAGPNELRWSQSFDDAIQYSIQVVRSQRGVHTRQMIAVNEHDELQGWSAWADCARSPIGSPLVGSALVAARRHTAGPRHGTGPCQSRLSWLGGDAMFALSAPLRATTENGPVTGSHAPTRPVGSVAARVHAHGPAHPPCRRSAPKPGIIWAPLLSSTGAGDAATPGHGSSWESARPHRKREAIADGSCQEQTHVQLQIVHVAALRAFLLRLAQSCERAMGRWPAAPGLRLCSPRCRTQPEPHVHAAPPPPLPRPPSPPLPSPPARTVMSMRLLTTAHPNRKPSRAQQALASGRPASRYRGTRA
jgi:hypothetical protein